jgi:chromosome segregation ATPase
MSVFFNSKKGFKTHRYYKINIIKVNSRDTPLLNRSKKINNLVRSYYIPMKSSISAKIDTELYEEVQAAIREEKYTSNTECIIKGLSLLLRNPDQENIEIESLLQEKEKEIQNLHEEVNRSKGEIHTLHEEVNRSKEEVNRSKEEVNRSKEDYIRQMKSLKEKLKAAPDSSELARLQARSEELEKHNLTLKGEMEKAHQDKEALQNLYDNYMRQMQTLIQQKAIEVPGKKKKWWKIW